MRPGALRVTVGIGGLVLLGAAKVLLVRALAQAPLYRYGLPWFFQLGPGERVFLVRYLLLGTAAASLLAWGATPWLRRLPPVPERWRRRLPRLAAAAAILAVAAGGFLLLANRVVTDDEYVYLFQARLLEHAKAVQAAPPGSEFLSNVFVVIQDGRWFGQYPPGHPLALVPGLLVGLPRLVPVALAGVNVWLTALLLGALAGTGAAALGAVLLLVSPLFLLTGSTLLSHPTSYAALTLACLAAVRAHRGRGRLWGAVAGAALGMLVITRPWTGVTLGLVPAAGLLWSARRTGRPGLLAATAAVGAVFAAFFLAYNWRVSGNPLVTGYQAVRGPGFTEFGFGSIIPGVHDHTPAQGLANAGMLLFRFQFWAWGWPLALLPAAFAFTRRPRNAEGGLARIALAMTLLGFASYVPYWSIGVNDTGPVKTYEILLPFTVLTVLGARGWAARHGRGPVAAWLGASTLCAAVLFWPPQITHLRAVARHVAAPLQAVKRTVEPPALVFVAGVQGATPHSWVYGRPNPDPGLTDPVLYVRHLGDRDLEFWRLHPKRRAYLLDYETGAPRVRRLSPRKGR